MIKTIRSTTNKNIGKIVFYSKDGKKRLGEWGFKTERERKSALTKAKKREREIKYFKNK